MRRPRWAAALLIFIATLGGGTGCLQVENSSSNDFNLSSGENLEETSSEFLEVRAIVDGCLGCHGDFGTTQAEWIQNGLVVPGEPFSSSLYFRLKGSEGPGTKNMPPFGSLVSEDVLKIQTWIENLPTN